VGRAFADLSSAALEPDRTASEAVGADATIFGVSAGAGFASAELLNSASDVDGPKATGFGSGFGAAARFATGALVAGADATAAGGAIGAATGGGRGPAGAFARAGASVGRGSAAADGTPTTAVLTGLAAASLGGADGLAAAFWICFDFVGAAGLASTAGATLSGGGGISMIRPVTCACDEPPVPARWPRDSESSTELSTTMLGAPAPPTTTWALDAWVKPRAPASASRLGKLFTDSIIPALFARVTRHLSSSSAYRIRAVPNNPKELALSGQDRAARRRFPRDS